MASLLLSRYDVFLLDEPTNDLDLDGLDRLERVRHRPARRHRAGQPRPGVPRPARSPGCVELDLAQQQVRALRRRLRGLPGGARGGPPARPRGLRGVRRHARPAWRPGPACSGPGWRRACKNARRKATDNDKIGRKFRAEATREAGRQGPADRAADRAAGRGRGAAQGVGAADGDRRRAPRRRGRGHAARRGGTPGRLHPRPGRPADRLGRPGRDHRRQRLGQVHAARRAARPAAAGRGHRLARARAWWSARSTRPAGCSSATSRCSTRSAPPYRSCRRRTCARCWPSSACAPRTCCARRPPCRRASGPGPRWRCCRRRGVNLLVLDEPTNHLDLPAIEQLESALASYPGTLLLVTHDRRMLEAVRTTRHLEVADGKVTG